MEEYQDLTSTAAYKQLQQLARIPYDLSGPSALLSDNRIEQYVCHSTYLRLLYGSQRVDDEILTALQELADQCGLVEQYRAMRRGAVINRIVGYESENRQVLHTSSRDLFVDSPAAPEATRQAQREMDKLQTFLAELKSGKLTNTKGESFTTLVHVGIGGSDLGPRAIYEALRPFALPGREVRFISNVDPDDAARALAGVDLSRTLVNIVSKSGTTLETLTNEMLVVAKLEAAGLEPSRHLISVTGEGSPMDNPEKYLRSFYMFDYIGGRYSATSMVGAVMLGYALGYDHLRDFLKGAAVADHEAENDNLRDNIALMLAMLGIWNHNFLFCPTLAILPYSQALHRFPAHLQQCDMESNGKSIDRRGNTVSYPTGPIIWGEPGTNGQHAFYQLLHQGREIVPVEFIGFLENQYGSDLEVAGSSSQEKLLANLLAQSIALASGKPDENPNKRFEGNRPSSLLLARRLTPATMGALLATYEAKIAFQGFCWNINSFDQEGVQLGKVLANRILEEMQRESGAVNSPEAQFLQAAFGGRD